jgi:hypothetical protein
MRHCLFGLVASALLVCCAEQSHERAVPGAGERESAASDEDMRGAAVAPVQTPDMNATDGSDTSASSPAISASGVTAPLGGGGSGTAPPGSPSASANDNSVPSLGAKAIELASGGNFFCVRLADGKVSCWGDLPARGQRVFPPEPQPELTSATQIGLANFTACGLLPTGKVRCFGENSTGQLGDGLRAHSKCPGVAMGDCSAAPVEVVGVSDAVDLAVTNWTGCVRTAAGSVQCWGRLPTSIAGMDALCSDGLNRGCAHRPITLAGITDARELVVTKDGSYADICVLRESNPPRCLFLDATPFTQV